MEGNDAPRDDLAALRARLAEVEAERDLLAVELEATGAREQRYRTLIESAEDFIFVVDLSGQVLYINDFGARRYGTRAQDIVGRSITELFPSAISSRQLANLARTVEAGHPIEFEGDNFIGGVHLWLHTRLTPAPGLVAGRPALLGISRDITEKKLVIDALGESEERYRDLFDSVLDGVVVHENGVILELNRSMARMWGGTREELLGHNVLELCAPEYRDFAARRMRDGETGMVELIGVRKDGTLVDVESETRPHFYRGRTVHLAFLRDVTERKRLREEVLKAQKLESVGTLAGGIAHDFNNILTALLGNIVLARRDVPEGGIVDERLVEAEQAVERATDLTRQLLTFSVGGAPIRRTSRVGDLVGQAATFALRGSNVKVDVSVAPDLWPADIDKGQVGQVIHNLVINAAQAMPGGGRVEVCCDNTEVGPGGPVGLAPGRYVRLSVRDNGIGIPPDRIGRVFDPYFTTKPGGTGLGLATSYSIVRGHGGHVSARSDPGRETVFTVLLPAADGLPSTESAGEAGPLVGVGRVLVMDDEPWIRDVLSEMLSTFGYQSTCVRDGAEAVDAWRRAKDGDTPFVAAILDLTVPGAMGGLEAAGQILEFDPQARLIATSGYFNNPVLARFGDYGFKGMLAKPYLLRTVGELLASVTSERCPSGPPPP